MERVRNLQGRVRSRQGKTAVRDGAKKTLPKGGEHLARESLEKRRNMTVR